MQGSGVSPERLSRPVFKVGVSAACFLAAFFVSCQAPEAEPVLGDLESSLKQGFAEGKQTFDHSGWNELLGKYAKEDGRKFDYAGLTSDEASEARLNEYVTALAKAELPSLSRQELLALFINAYNAYTVKTILDKVSAQGEYEIESIRDIRNVFDREEHVVGGFRLSLNNIEHNILRPYFKDPRIHFVVNCASTSCPPLPVKAFTGESVEEQLEAEARNVLSSPDYIRVEEGRLLVTKFMDWYGSDFVKEGYRGAERHLSDYIKKYTRQDVREWIVSQSSPPKPKFMKYDWSLNRTS